MRIEQLYTTCLYQGAYFIESKGEIAVVDPLRDPIPYIEKANKINVFNGKILEIEGLPDLKLEQAFELTDASAERSCAGCSIALSKQTITEYLQSNISLLKNMIARGYKDPRTLARRIQAMNKWLEKPKIITADSNAIYSSKIEINLNIKLMEQY